MSSETGASESLRRGLDASADPRVARTREAIAQAVHRLSQRGAVMTVSAIVQEAGISRAGFYAHYAGIDELAAAMQRHAFEVIAAEYRSDHADPASAMRTSQRMLVAHYADNLALYRAVARMPVSKEAYLSGVRGMADLIASTLEPHSAAFAHGTTAATARYIAGAAYGLIDAWLADEVDLDSEELVERLTTLLPRWFSGIE